MSFPTLDRLVILTAEHVYSGRPGARFRVHGLLRSEDHTVKLLFTLNTMTLLAIFAGKSRGQNNCSFGDYADVDRFSQNFLLTRWSVSYLLMYT